MSTLESVVPPTAPRQRLWNERSLPLGPGLLRLSDGSFRKPLSADFHVRCMGPLAHWSVTCRFDLSNLPGGHERALLLYPLPPQASLLVCRVSQEEALGAEPEVRALEELPPDNLPPIPSKGMLDTFGGETLPIFSLALDPYLAAYEPGRPLELQLTFSNGLPTVDGRILLAIPGRVAEELVASGPATSISFQVEIEDGDELVDDPTSNVELAQEKQAEILSVTGKAVDATSDLEITFRPGRTEMPVTRLRRGDGHFLFSIFPPTSIPASPQRRDLVFAVDASENVLGGLFDTIREDLTQILRTLDDNDRFALVTYGRDIDGYQGGDLCQVSQVEEACQWLQTVEPKGRADVQPLLASIQSLPSEPERQLCIFLLAAGHVGNEPAILKSLDFDQSDRRYYAVGLGPTVQQAFLRRLALLTRGRCEVAPEGDCAEALRRLLGQTRALLAEVTFEDQEGAEAEIDAESLVPSRMTSLTAEGPVHCLGVGTPESLRFRSKDETGVFFAGTVNARATTNPALEGVWAGMRVREMIDSVRLSAGAKRKQLRAEAAALASQHGILVEDTVLVLESDGGLDVQLSALPYRWRKVAQPVAKAEEEAAPAFDWRKGLKARDGLFKGGRMPGQEGDGDGVRHGLRSRGGGMEMPGKPSAKAGKPMLDRYSMGSSSNSIEEEPEVEAEELVSEVFPSSELSEEVASHSSVEAEPSVDEEESEPAEVLAQVEIADEPAEVETETAAEVAQAQSSPAEEPEREEPEVEEAEAEAEEVEEQPEVAAAEEDLPEVEPDSDEALVASGVSEPVAEAVAPEPTAVAGGVSAPVVAASLGDTVVTYAIDPMSEASLRLESYLRQSESVDSRLALSALAGMPTEVSAAGVELPRILAQTVAHLEKRGYYSAAVSVLGLMLRENASPEVTKKMESLVVGWATSLSEEHLPEALHILSLGARICPGGEAIAEAAEQLQQRWAQVAEQRGNFPAILNWRSSAAPDQPIPSPAQVELLELKQKQEALTSEVAALKSSLEEKLNALPALFERLLESRPTVVASPAVAAAPAPAPTQAEEAPQPAAPRVEELAPLPELSQAEEPAPLPELRLPDAEPDPAVSTEASPVAEEAPTPFEIPLPIDIPIPPSANQPEAAESTAAAEVEPESAEAAPADLTEPSVELVDTAPAVSEPDPAPAAAAAAEPEPEEESGEGLNLTKDELLELLQAEPKDESGHRAVKIAFPDPKDRINFYRDLVRADADQPAHSLALARAYKDADQTKVAVVHYQKYLRSDKDRKVYLELADAYDELGKSNLSVSARKAAETLN